MKISILIAAIIIGIAAYFGLDQKEKIKHLTTEWEELKTTAIAKNISADPKATFSSQRARSDHARAARERAISDFATELAAFAQKVEAAKEDGSIDQTAIQKEVVGFLGTLTNMSPSDLKSLIKALSADPSIKDETKRELVMSSILMISGDHPEAALAIFTESSESIGLGGSSRMMLPMIFGQYATKDPEAAAAWLIENGDQLGDKEEDTKKQLILTIAQNSFESALAMIDTLGLKDKNESYSSLAAGLKAGDQEKFLAALDAASLNKEDREKSLRSLANSAFIKEDFQAASTWLDSPELSTTDKDTIVDALEYHSIKDSAKEWLGWLSQQEDESDSVNQTTREILRGWTRDNFVAAGEWIQTQKDGPAKITAIETYAKTLAPHEPAAAGDWAATLPDGPEREQLFRSIHGFMKDKDLEAASAFAEQHGLAVDPAE